jgi:hypothetical protein
MSGRVTSLGEALSYEGLGGMRHFALFCPAELLTAGESGRCWQPLGCVDIYRHSREMRPLHNHRHTRENGYPGVEGQLK